MVTNVVACCACNCSICGCVVLSTCGSGGNQVKTNVGTVGWNCSECLKKGCCLVQGVW